MQRPVHQRELSPARGRVSGARRPAAWCLLVMLAALLPAVLRAGEGAPLRTFALRGATVYTVSGEIYENSNLVVEDGRIKAVGKDVKIPAGIKIHDLRGYVVMPGLLDAETNLASDNRETLGSLSPQVQALDGWDFYRENRELLRGGVTSVYLAPGVPVGKTRTRLISGQGAVVKTAGFKANPRMRVVAESSGFQVTLGELSRIQPSIYSPPVGASPDNPFEVLVPPLPQSRAGEFLALRQVISRARGYRDSLAGHLRTGTSRPAYDPISASLYPVIAGGDHLRVRANKARDIYHILELAREAGIKVVIEGGAEAEKLTSWLARMKVPVIFPGAFQSGKLPGGDLQSPAIEGRLQEESILRMHRAGVSVILNSPTDAEGKNLLLQAAAAVRIGMEPHEALRTITLNPARVLGVADRIGSISEGKDADLVVLGGDPLSADNLVQAVFINGELVFNRAPPITEDCTVIRAGRLVIGSGAEYSNGIVIVRKGKIEYAGPGLLHDGMDKAVRVIDASSQTVIPGLIDAGGTAGSRAESLVPGFDAAPGSAGAGKAADFRLVDSIDPRDPALMELVRAGITTALIAPPVAGQVSALKLAANDPAAAVIKPYAAQYFSKSSSKTLKAAKAYHDSWVAFEKKKEAAEKKGAEFKDKAPKLKEAYEPYRALFTGAVPALVEAPNAASVPGIVALYTDQYKIRVLCSGLASLKSDENLAGMAGLLLAKTGGLVLQNPLVVKQDNKTVNWPQRLSALGISFSVRSRVADGARLLPLQVSYAVREGWNSRLALRSMTTVPAEQFGISDRVGSIEKGKDADLVILSGEPFSLTARVLGVMVDGKLVHGVDKFKGQVDANE